MGDASVGKTTVGGNGVGVLAGTVGVALAGIGAAVLVGAARDLVGIAGTTVGGGICVDAQAAMIATTITAPIRQNSFAMRQLVFAGE